MKIFEELMFNCLITLYLVLFSINSIKTFLETIVLHKNAIVDLVFLKSSINLNKILSEISKFNLFIAMGLSELLLVNSVLTIQGGLPKIK